MNNLWFTHTVEYYSAMKRNAVLIHNYSMAEPKKLFTVKETRQKVTCYTIPVIWKYPKQVHPLRQSISGVQGLRQMGKKEATAEWVKDFLWG